MQPRASDMPRIPCLLLNCILNGFNDTLCLFAKFIHEPSCQVQNLLDLIGQLDVGWYSCWNCHDARCWLCSDESLEILN